MKTFDPYPSLSTSAPELGGKSPLEPGSNYGRRRKKWAFDNAKYAGAKRAAEMLNKQATSIPQPKTTKDV